MKDVSAQVVCPKCDSLVEFRGNEASRLCPTCAHPLSDPAGMPPPPETQDSPLATGPFTEENAADELLLSNLRSAFAYHSEALASPDSCWLAGGESGAHGGIRDAVAMPPGTRLGDFEILGELGRGGMGIVYRARQCSLGREVALKVLPGYAKHGPSAVNRFKSEAQAAARIHHTNVVSIYSQGEHKGQYYYAMELIKGLSLAAIIHGRGVSPGSSVHQENTTVERQDSEQAAEGSRIDSPLRHKKAEPHQEKTGSRNWTPAEYRRWSGRLAEVADALECAHRQGVIHRDVKPHNILSGDDGRLHLMDFGLARLVQEPHLTCDGEVMGTPAYLSPEQLKGSPSGIDHRTDVYSLGVTLYELLTRRKPFQGETREQIIHGICSQPPVPPHRLVPHLPRDLETICLRAIEKDPERRHPSAAMLAEDLRRFCEGRPILSRRVGRLRRAWRWTRRHKTQAALIAVSAAVIVISAGAVWNTRVVHRREARSLLRNAYEQLAFFNHRGPQRVQADISRAGVLGAEPVELHLTRALAAIGSDDHAGGVSHLQTVLDMEPSNLRARYMLAWAQWRRGERPESRLTFKEAETARSAGAPMAADAWLFRGLAIHYDDPVVAIESYRRANALRARDQAYFPMAVLHLARARNQKLYATRSLDGFSEAEGSLRQLIENEHYGAYPYYLLSITHRLAAEVYQGSQGTRDDSLVARHYAEAMKWARAGQEVDAGNDRPITAEAECLESMGRYDQAIKTRTRAIETAFNDAGRHEGHHYRWRLYYWTGQLDAALADLRVNAGFDPDSRFYAHVYPALVHAEMGNMQTALAHARAIADEAPHSAMAVLWSATSLRLLGEPEEADALLAERLDQVDFTTEIAPPQSAQWVEALYVQSLQGGSHETLDELAEQADAPWRLWGEAYFHAAASLLASGDREEAQAAFLRAYRSFDGEQRYTYHAKTIWIQMRDNPTWPMWIPAVRANDAAAEAPPIATDPQIASITSGEARDS